MAALRVEMFDEGVVDHTADILPIEFAETASLATEIEALVFGEGQRLVEELARAVAHAAESSASSFAHRSKAARVVGSSAARIVPTSRAWQRRPQVARSGTLLLPLSAQFGAPRGRPTWHALC